MSLTTFARSRSRAALALVAGLVLAGAVSSPAGAVKPAGSLASVQLETGSSASGNPANAITSGWWGHEGGANNGTGIVVFGSGNTIGGTASGAAA